MGRDEGEGDEMRRDRGLPGGASRVRPARPGWTARWFSIPAGPRNFTMQKGPGRGGEVCSQLVALPVFATVGRAGAGEERQLRSDWPTSLAPALCLAR